MLSNKLSRLGLVVIAALSSCTTQTPRAPTPSTPDLPPPNIASIPEPTPKVEPRSALGNPPFYDVLGKRYFVLQSAAGFVERGIASWYGPGFHKERTSTGDPYDMYAMTAAHKTLPLPCYARVTNLSNGKSVVVYINDRGPFKDGRIVDLSYTAAAKLDILKAGTAPVELEVLTPSASITSQAPLFVQAGSFGDATNARRLVEKLRVAGYSQASVRKDSSPRALHRVLLGPLASVEEFDRVVAGLKSLGINEARLATQ